jgi:hypothetical protein
LWMCSGWMVSESLRAAAIQAACFKGSDDMKAFCSLALRSF